MRLLEGEQRFGFDVTESVDAVASAPSRQFDATPSERRGEMSVGTSPEALTPSCLMPP
jgi:hypothetical protein